MKKKGMSLILALLMFFALCYPAQAKTNVTVPKSGRFYRICYAYNSRYLDIPAENYENNGTQLQLWDYAYGNQNQIFKLIDTGNGWRIVGQNGKIVEVRDSRHDDYAPVAQWDAHSLNCGLWYIRDNSDGTVSFQNKESGKFLNVMGGGDAGNGTKIIQYYDDGTIAMRFKLELLDVEDVYSATFQRTLYNTELSWVRDENTSSFVRIYNLSGWSYVENNVLYRPELGQELFVSMEFISPNNVANLIKKRSYDKSVWVKIREALAGELSSQAITSLAESLGYNIPCVGVALSILQIIWDNQDSNKWNRFLDAVEIDERGRYSGAIAYYYDSPYITEMGMDDFALIMKKYRDRYYGTFEQSRFPFPYGQSGISDLSSEWYTYYAIKLQRRVEYKPWSGDNFGDVYHCPVNVKGGSWNLSFK